MITDMKVSYYPFENLWGTQATYLSDGVPMSARFSREMKPDEALREITRRNGQLPRRPFAAVN